MKKFAALLFFLALTGLTVANASDALTLGKTVAIIVPGDTRDCTGDLIENHDGSFENGYAWQGAGVAPPYYGAMAEGFDVSGPKTLTCISMYLTTIQGLYQGQLMDIYVWEGGAAGMHANPPGAVLYMNPGQAPVELPIYPECAQNTYEINMDDVNGEITVGYWAVDTTPGFFLMGDTNGFGGEPWTCFAPGQHPTNPDGGWDDASVVPEWQDLKSFSLGIYLDEGGAPTESSTWGSIKALFE